MFELAKLALFVVIYEQTKRYAKLCLFSIYARFVV